MNSFVSENMINNILENDINLLIENDVNLVECISTLQEGIQKKLLGNIFDFTKMIFGSIGTTLLVKVASIHKNSWVDDNLTEIVQKIIGNTKIQIRHLTKQGVANSFAFQNTVYYTTELADLLNKNELISIILHEYGEFQLVKKVSKKTIDLAIGATIATVIYMFLKSKSDTLAEIYYNIMAKLGQNLIIKTDSDKVYGYNSKSFAIKMGYKKYYMSAMKKIYKETSLLVCRGVSSGKCNKRMSELGYVDKDPKIKQVVKNVTNSSSLSSLLSRGKIGAVVKWLGSVGNKITDSLWGATEEEYG